MKLPHKKAKRARKKVNCAWLKKQYFLQSAKLRCFTDYFCFV